MPCASSGPLQQVDEALLMIMRQAFHCLNLHNISPQPMSFIHSPTFEDNIKFKSLSTRNLLSKSLSDLHMHPQRPEDTGVTDGSMQPPHLPIDSKAHTISLLSHLEQYTKCKISIPNISSNASRSNNKGVATTECDLMVPVHADVFAAAYVSVQRCSAVTLANESCSCAFGDVSVVTVADRCSV